MLDFNMLKSKRNNFIFVMGSRINVKLLITVICLAFLGSSIYGNFESLSNQTIAKKEILWLFSGTLFSFLSVIINAYAWKLLIYNIDCNSNNLNIIKIFLTTNLYKYFPGGIWHFVSRYNILRVKLSTEKAVQSILLEPLLMLVAGLIFVPFGSFNISIFILCWSSVLVFLPGFREFIIKKLKVIKSSIFTNNNQHINQPLAENKQNILMNISYPYRPLFVEIAFILFRFFGFLCCINAFSIGSLIPQYQLISFFALAWIIGLVVPAAPGGLGVFESVILFCLGAEFPEAPLLASLLCYRLVSTISDILAALIYPVIKFFKVLKLKYLC